MHTTEASSQAVLLAVHHAVDWEGCNTALVLSLMRAFTLCRQLNETILNFAAGLKAHGLQQGDKVRDPAVVFEACGLQLQHGIQQSAVSYQSCAPLDQLKN